MQISPTCFPFLTAGRLPHCLQHHSEKGFARGSQMCPMNDVIVHLSGITRPNLYCEVVCSVCTMLFFFVGWLLNVPATCLCVCARPEISSVGKTIRHLNFIEFQENSHFI